MSLRPVIFISAVSKELKFARQLVADTLTSLGYEPDWQDIFGTEAGDLPAMLRRKVDAASAVVQLVGNGYGAEPAAPLPGFGRVSYTQYEALYALSRGKKVYYLFLGPDFPAEPSAPVEPEELRALQTAYRESIRATGSLRYPAGTHTELENKILRLRNDLAHLRRRTRQWAIAISIAALLTIAGIAWLIHTVTHLETKQSESAARETLLLQALREFPRNLGRDGARGGTPGDPALMAKAYATLEEELKLPTGTLAKELPTFAERLLLRSDTSAIDRARALLVQKKYAEAEATALAALRASGPDADPATRMAALQIAACGALAQEHHPDALSHLRAGAALASKDRDPLEWVFMHHLLAHSLYMTGDFAGAASLLRTIVPVAVSTLGAESRETLEIRSTLANALGKTGKKAEALAEDQEVLAIRQRVLGPEDPDTLISRHNTTNSVWAIGLSGAEEAEAEFRALLETEERVLGAEHPDTLSTGSSVAVAVFVQGKFEPWLKLARTLLASQQRVLGEEHPVTITSRLNLAAGLKLMQRFPEALVEAQAALAASTRVLGKEHPDTIKLQALVEELKPNP